MPLPWANAVISGLRGQENHIEETTENNEAEIMGVAQRFL